MKKKSLPEKYTIQYSFILVFSTSHAIHAEKLLKNAGIPCKLVPVPRHLSSDCGISIRIDHNDKDTVVKVLEKNDFEFDAIHDN